MSRRRSDGGPAVDIDAAARGLLKVLAAELESHRRLAACLREKRSALRMADVDAIQRHCEEARDLARGLHASERRRVALVDGLTRALAPEAKAPLDLTAIAQACAEATREALLAAAAELRAAVEAVQRDSSVVASAAHRLARHVGGIMQSVNGAVSRAGLYERRGRIAVGSQVEFCVDVTS